MKLNVAVLLGSVGAATARYAANLNYDSPSAHHPFLGISLFKVVRRHDTTVRSIDASALNFTHGIASGDPYANSVVLWTRVSPDFDNDKSNGKLNDTQVMEFFLACLTNFLSDCIRHCTVVQP